MKDQEDRHKPIVRFWKDRRWIFHRNFDPIAYREAIAPIIEAANLSTTAYGFYKRLKNMSNGTFCESVDLEYFDEGSCVWTLVEMDRTRIIADTDYVGIWIGIYWPGKQKEWKIAEVTLYSKEYSCDEYAVELCSFDPETYEILEWRL